MSPIQRLRLAWRVLTCRPGNLMLHAEAGAVPAQPVSPEVAAWNAEVDRKKADKLARRMKAHDDAMRAELAKVSQR